MAQVRTPINKNVLRWAIAESGLDLPAVAHRVRRPLDEVEGWVEGTGQPTRAQLRRLSEELRRPSAFFYLAEPPAEAGLPANLRSAPGLGSKELTLREVRSIRWMLRLQRTLAWLAKDDPAATPPSVPTSPPGGEPSSAAEAAREWLGVTVADQIAQPNGREALKLWRNALEDRGLLVTQFQIDRQAIRGFSAWNDLVPLIAVNTAYTPQARTYSLMHELGHLVRRDGSACAGFVGPNDERRVERWCEEFAAALLLPQADFAAFAPSYVGSEDGSAYETVKSLARTFNVSVRATAIRLIELGRAETQLYDTVDRAATAAYDDFPQVREQSGGGETSPEMRLRQLGPKVVRELLAASDAGSITSRDVGDYLHLTPNQVTDIASLARG